ncbi:MAG: TOBE domain-containing protein [Campylobacterales bacterium]|nr:TOBE domain-containing protein [Campylobacterales bacterium]
MNINNLEAKVISIQSVEDLNIVKFEFENHILSMMSLGLKDTKINSRVILSANPSHIAIAKDFSGLLSYSNQIKTKITHIEMGELLCSIELEIGKHKLNSLITASSAQRLNLKINDEVLALIKASELSIKDVL